MTDSKKYENSFVYWANEFPLNPYDQRESIDLQTTNLRHAVNMLVCCSKEPDYFAHDLRVENGIFFITIYLKTNEELYGKAKV